MLPGAKASVESYSCPKPQNVRASGLGFRFGGGIMLDAYDLQLGTPQTLSNSQLKGLVGLGSDPPFRIRTEKENISRWGAFPN